MSYNSFFGFSGPPFNDDLDQKFLFLSKQFELFLTELSEFVGHHHGIAVISGDDGVGKTMLLRAFLERLPPSVQPLLISRPMTEPPAVMLLVAQSLGISLGERNLIHSLSEAFWDAAQKGKYFLLVLDDAHLLTDQHLEEIQVLSHMELQGQPIISILLAGRTGLVQKLASKTNQRLQKLIRCNLVLAGLTFEETTRYIDHRLQQVGSSFHACFAEGCSGQLFSRTGGVPRRINQVCDQTLNRTWQEQQPRVTRDLVGENEVAPPYKSLTPLPQYSFPTRFIGFAAAVAMAGLVGYLLYNKYYATPPRSSPPVADRAASPTGTLSPPQQEESSSAPSETVTQVQPRHQAEERAIGQDESTPSEPQASQAPEPPQALPQAEDSAVSRQESLATEAETPRPTTHQVDPEDGGLLKIASRYYPEGLEPGYNAIILANPQISNEDILYPGQNLSLPTLNTNNNVITYNNDHYLMFQSFYDSAQVEKAVSKLKELEIRFVIRETWLPDAGQIYRIYLGGYERQEELMKVMALAEKPK